MEAGQNDKIERCSVSDRAVRTSRKDLDLRTTHSEIVKPDNLSLVGACQEHKAIARLRRQFCGIRFLRLIFGARYADQQGRQRQRKNRSENRTTSVAGGTPIVARLHVASPSFQGFCFGRIFWFGISSNSVA